MNSYKYCCFPNTLNILIAHAHGPRINNEIGMRIHVCFYFRGKKKENSIKKKNEHGDICFLNNYKFLYKIPFKVYLRNKETQQTLRVIVSIQYGKSFWCK